MARHPLGSNDVPFDVWQAAYARYVECLSRCATISHLKAIACQALSPNGWEPEGIECINDAAAWHDGCIAQCDLRYQQELYDWKCSVPNKLAAEAERTVLNTRQDYLSAENNLAFANEAVMQDIVALAMCGFAGSIAQRIACSGVAIRRANSDGLKRNEVERDVARKRSQYEQALQAAADTAANAIACNEGS